MTPPVPPGRRLLRRAAARQPGRRRARRRRPRPTTQMQRFARWTNLSETTFLLPPDRARGRLPAAHLHPGGELPFAGHPTLGQRARVARGRRRAAGDAGRAGVRRRAGARPPRRRLAFAAPPLLRSGPGRRRRPGRDRRARCGIDARRDRRRAVGRQRPGLGRRRCSRDADGRAGARARLRARSATSRSAWSGRTRRRLRSAASRSAAFCPELAVAEDPVTGSLNAGLGAVAGRHGACPSRTSRRRAPPRPGRPGAREREGDARSGSAATPRPRSRRGPL